MNRWTLALFSMLTLSSIVFAFPSLLSLDGFLTNSSGTALNGSFSFVFNLYNNSTGGSALWTETQTVTVSSGRLNALLGSVSPLNLPFDQDYYLGVKVGADSEMSPRYRIASSAYAYTAKNLAQDATALGGLRLGNATSACTSENAGTLRWTGAGRLEVCDRSSWQLVWTGLDGSAPSNAAPSCRSIKTNNYSTGDGSYWIDPNGGSTGDAFRVYCDMTTDGGGWSLVMKVSAQLTSTGAVSTADLATLPVTMNAKLADSDIINLANTLGQREWMAKSSSMTYIGRYSAINWASWATNGAANMVYEVKASSGSWSATTCNGHYNNRGFSTYSDAIPGSCATIYSGTISDYMAHYHTTGGVIGAPFVVFVR